MLQQVGRNQKDGLEKVLNTLWKKLDQTVAQLKYQTLSVDVTAGKTNTKQNQRSRLSLNVLRYQQQRQRNLQLQASLQQTGQSVQQHGRVGILQTALTSSTPMDQSSLQPMVQQPVHSVQSNAAPVGTISQPATGNQISFQSNAAPVGTISQPTTGNQISLQFAQSTQNIAANPVVPIMNQPVIQIQSGPPQQTIQTAHISSPITSAPSTLNQSVTAVVPQRGHSPHPVSANPVPCVVTSIPTPSSQSMVQQQIAQPLQLSETRQVITAIPNTLSPVSHSSEHNMGLSPSGMGSHTAMSPVVTSPSTCAQGDTELVSSASQDLGHRGSYSEFSTPVIDAALTNKSPRRKTVAPRRRETPGGEENADEMTNRPEDIPDDENLEISQFLESLLSNTQLHEKLAENINKAVISDPNTAAASNSQSASSESLNDLLDIHVTDDTVSEIISSTSQDPVFESLFALFNVERPDKADDQSDAATSSQNEDTQSCKKKTNQRGNSNRKLSKPKKQSEKEAVIVTQGTQQLSQLNQIVSVNSAHTNPVPVTVSNLERQSQQTVQLQPQQQQQMSVPVTMERIVTDLPLVSTVNTNGIRSLRQTHVRNLDFTSGNDSDDAATKKRKPRRRGVGAQCLSQPTVRDQLSTLRSARTGDTSSTDHRNDDKTHDSRKSTKRKKRQVSKAQLLANANIRIHPAPLKKQSVSTQDPNRQTLIAMPVKIPRTNPKTDSQQMEKQMTSPSVQSPQSPAIAITHGNVSVIRHAVTTQLTKQNAKIWNLPSGSTEVSKGSTQSVTNQSPTQITKSATIAFEAPVTCGHSILNQRTGQEQQKSLQEPGTASSEVTPSPRQHETHIALEQPATNEETGQRVTVINTEESGTVNVDSQTVHETRESGDTSISESSECYEPVEHPPSVANEEVVEITEDLSASEFIQENDENDRQSSIDVSSVQEGNTIDHEKQNCDEKKLRRKESAIASPSNSNNVVKISTPVKGTLTSDDSRGGERSLVKRSTNVETTTDSGGESMRDCIDVAESLVNLANTVVQRETSPSKSQKTKRTIEASDKHDEEIEQVVKSSSESQRQEQTTQAATDVELENLTALRERGLRLSVMRSQRLPRVR
ncbi:uncharacterized protein [Ptychodera flava]